MKGHVSRRGKSWRLKYDLPPGPDGKRRTARETVRGGGKKEAYAKLAQRLAAISKGEHIEPSKVTVAAHVAARIDVWAAAGTIGNATQARYNTLLKKQITPHIGETTLQRLGPADVEAWHAALRKSGLAPATIRNAHRLLGKALRDAVRNGQIPRSVAGRDGQQAPAVPANKPDIVRKDQIDDVVEKLHGQPIFPKAMLALFCGLRAGEVLALRWDRIDLDGKFLWVRESVEEVAGEPLQAKPPKTEAGVRKVTLPAIVIEALQAHNVRQLELRMKLGQGRRAEDALVFPTLNGDLSRRTGLSIEWGKTVDALGLPDVTFHALRHTHASMLIAAKVDLATIASRLGHASPAITLKVYAHLFERDDTAAADAIDAVFGSGPHPVPKKG